MFVHIKIKMNYFILLFCLVFVSTVICETSKIKDETRNKRTVGLFLTALANFLNVQDFPDTTSAPFITVAPSQRKKTQPPPKVEKWPPLDFEITPWVLQAQPTFTSVPPTTPIPQTTTYPYTTEEPRPYHAQIIIIPLTDKEKQQNNLKKETGQYYRPNSSDRQPSYPVQQNTAQGNRFQLGVHGYDQRNAKQIVQNQVNYPYGSPYQQQQQQQQQQQPYSYNKPHQNQATNGYQNINSPYNYQQQSNLAPQPYLNNYFHTTTPVPIQNQQTNNQVENPYKSYLYNQQPNSTNQFLQPQVGGYIYSKPKETITTQKPPQKYKNQTKENSSSTDSILKHKDADIIFRLGYLYGKAQKDDLSRIAGNDLSNEKYDNFRAYIEQEPRIRHSTNSNLGNKSEQYVAERNKRLKINPDEEHRIEKDSSSVHVEIVKSLEPDDVKFEERQVQNEEESYQQNVTPDYLGTTTQTTVEMVKSYELATSDDPNYNQDYEYQENYQGNNYGDSNFRNNGTGFKNGKISFITPSEREYYQNIKNNSVSSNNNLQLQNYRPFQNVNIQSVADPNYESELDKNTESPNYTSKSIFFKPRGSTKYLHFFRNKKLGNQSAEYAKNQDIQPIQNPENIYPNSYNIYSPGREQDLNNVQANPQDYSKGIQNDYPQQNPETQVSFFYPEEESLQKPEKQQKFPNQFEYNPQDYGKDFLYPSGYDGQFNLPTRELSPSRTYPLKFSDNLHDQISHINDFQKKFAPPAIFDQDTARSQNAYTCLLPLPFIKLYSSCLGNKSRKII